MQFNEATPKSSLKVSELSFYLQKSLVPQITQVGLQDGFQTAALRLKAYSLLLGLPQNSLEAPAKIGQTEDGPPQGMSLKNYKIMLSDIERSIAANPLLCSKPAEIREQIAQKVRNLLCLFFARNPQYSYYQGFNSVAEAIVLNFEEQDAVCLLEGISKALLASFLDPAGFEQAIQGLAQALAKMLKKVTGIAVQPKFA